MRFRVWDKLEECYSMDRQFNVNVDGKVYYGNAIFDSETEIEYYTDIFDKNGDEVCQGDVVKYFYSGYKTGYVEFSNGRFIVGAYSLHDLAGDIEIIGTINKR